MYMFRYVKYLIGKSYNCNLVMLCVGGEVFSIWKCDRNCEDEKM